MDPVTPLETWLRTTQDLLDRGTPEAGRSRIPVPRSTRPGPPPVDQAMRIAERLADLAVGGEDRVDWLGIKMIGPEAWTIAPINGNLYDGAGGLALFFAHLADLTGDDDARFLAEAALDVVHRTRDTAGRRPGMAGRAGLVHVYTHLGVLWGRDDLLTAAEDLCVAIPDQTPDDERLDLLGGAAGNLMAAAALARVTGSGIAGQAAVASAAHLAATATPQPEGLAWITDLCPRPLGGFSHGSAGIAAALLDFHALSGDPEARDLAQAALAHDRSLFDTARGHWTDQRVETPFAMNAWCHGSAGIGMMRLRWRDHLDTYAETEIRISIDAILADDLGTSHTLCHGAVGNALVASEASRRSGHRTDEVDARVDTVLASLDEGIVCGSFPGAEVPGLFCGLAGVGLGLLRLAAPERVPCPLTFRLQGS